MKKFFALIVSVACIFSILTVFVSAEDSYEDIFEDIDMTGVELSYAVDSYLSYAELCNGYFAEGSAPSADAVYQLLMWDVEFECDQYIASQDEYGYNTYHIPADVYEEMAAYYFYDTSAISAVLKASEFYNAEGDYYVITVDDGAYGLVPTASLYGYEVRDDGKYVAYAQLIETLYDEETGEEISYIPSEDDVEGVDYIYVPSMWSDELMNGETEIESLENIEFSYGYVAVKLAGYIRSVTSLDTIVDEYGDEYALSKLVSYEKVVGEAIPESDDLIIFDSSSLEDIMLPEIEAMLATILGSYISYDETSIDVGTVITTANVTTGESYDKAAAAMEGVSENYTVFELKATNAGEAAELTGEIRVTFAIPEDFSEDFELFLISEDGEPVAVPCEINADLDVIVAGLSKLGTFVMADAPVIKAPEETTKAPETTKEPETTKSPETTKAPETTDAPETTKPAEKPHSPQTGDNMLYVAVVATLALASCSAVVVARRKISK